MFLFVSTTLQCFTDPTGQPEVNEEEEEDDDKDENEDEDENVAE